ncbi:NAD(P)-binding protein [Hypoxylon crocopeplum]|nr:NAD(P)-binding protein [Hypoxylon crocopeplum]
MDLPLQKLTPTYHREPYAAISPLRPELSQAGKTVLITGGGGGIGYATARAFVAAHAKKIIIVGRRAEVIARAASTLAKEADPQTQVVGWACDVGNRGAVGELWGRVAGEKEVVDVLVLNAANLPPHESVLEIGTERVWTTYDFNVRAQMDMAERFYKQGGEGRKYLVHVSTMAIHAWRVATSYPAYGMTKNAGALALQTIAQDVPVEKMQVLSFHPGAIFTEGAENNGLTKDSYHWDDTNLPAHYAVWAATPEAAFLHGRFTWAHWDVDELKSGEARRRIDEDPEYLKIGVNGL